MSEPLTDEYPGNPIVLNRTAPPDDRAGAGDAAPSDIGSTAQAQLDKITSEVAQMAEAAAATLPAHLKPLVPTGLSPLERLRWIQKAASLSNQSPHIPSTEPPRTVSPALINPKNPVSRIAAGYNR